LIRNIHFVQPMQGSCQHWCTPFFWTPLRRIPGKNTLFRSRAVFARDDTSNASECELR